MPAAWLIIALRGRDAHSQGKADANSQAVSGYLNT